MRDILGAIVGELLDFLRRMFERGSTAVDADERRVAHRRAGTRLRKWLHKNGAREPRKPGADRS
jgi:hypothetical protein